MASQEQSQPLNNPPEPEKKQQPDDGEIYASVLTSPIQMEQKKIPEFESERGRQHLLCNQYEKAAKAFSKAIMAFEYLVRDHKLTPEEIRDMLKHTIVPCYSNLTLSYFKQGMYESVVKFATSVLENDKDNVKAFYRRGVAYKHLKQYRGAKSDLTRVKALDESMADEIDKLMADIARLQAQQRQKQKKVAETMISGYVDSSESAAPAAEVSSWNSSCKKLAKALSRFCSKLTSYFKRNT